jgi:hypothetical protein
MDDTTELDPDSLDKEVQAALLRAHLGRAKSLRLRTKADLVLAADRMRLREWQAQRLARTHRDLLDSPRYRTPATFFLSDLYGPKDFSTRDEELERILPMIVSMLPPAGVRTVALAVEVDALSEELDAALAQALRHNRGSDAITDEAYGDAYRACGVRPMRERQILLIVETGRALARLTRIPLVGMTILLMRAPAHLAGLGELHEFLEQGFNAFRLMGDPAEFLETIRTRETAIMERLFAGDPPRFDCPES